MTTAMQPSDVADPSKRPLPNIEGMQGWATLGEVELTARITDLLDHADE